MFVNTMLNIVFCISFIFVFVLGLRALIKTIKFGELKDCKKMLFFHIALFISLALMELLCIAPLGFEYIEYYKLIVINTLLLAFLVVPALIVVYALANVVQKKKKMQEKNMSFKNLYISLIIGIIIVFTLSINISIFSKNINKLNALAYYNDKYDLKVNVINTEYTYEGRGMSLLPDKVNGVIYQLDNDDKIYFNYEEKTYYDNRQSQNIKKFVDDYYEEIFNNITEELKKENSLAYYTKNEEAILGNYSRVKFLNARNKFKYLDKDEFYTNNLYNFNSIDKESSIRKLVESGDVKTTVQDVTIVCDKNGYWKNILEKYKSRLQYSQYILFFYDVQYANIAKTETFYSDYSFAYYKCKDRTLVEK